MDTLKNIFQKVSSYGSLFGFGFYVFFFRSATMIEEQNQDADLVDFTVGFYEGMVDTVSDTFLSGAGITLGAALIWLLMLFCLMLVRLQALQLIH